jgi:hypothetical protein
VRSALAAALLCALWAAAPAAAHVIASPAFLAQGSTQTIELSAPNERDAPMTAFTVTAPEGIEIASAEESVGWEAVVEGKTATWSGGSLPPALSETFGLQLRATAKPGPAELEAEQLYADGKVRWPVSLTIVPATGSSSSGSSWLVIGAIVAVGGLVTAAIALLAWRQRKGQLQER